MPSEDVERYALEKFSQGVHNSNPFRSCAGPTARGFFLYLYDRAVCRVVGNDGDREERPRKRRRRWVRARPIETADAGIDKNLTNRARRTRGAPFWLWRGGP